MSYCSPVTGPCGQRFPSQAAACRAFGISKTTLQYHLNTHGDLSRFGMGKSRPNCQNAAKALTIGSLTWPSRAAAAGDLGISYHQLIHWISPKASPVMRDKLAAAMMRHIAVLDAEAYAARGARDIPAGRPAKRRADA